MGEPDLPLIPRPGDRSRSTRVQGTGFEKGVDKITDDNAKDNAIVYTFPSPARNDTFFALLMLIHQVNSKMGDLFPNDKMSRIEFEKFFSAIVRCEQLHR